MGLPNIWMKAGAGGSYSGYIKPRKEVGVISDKQRAARNKFRTKAIGCKGKPQAEFRACMAA